jgi:hypothetical protein
MEIKSESGRGNSASIAKVKRLIERKHSKSRRKYFDIANAPPQEQ